MKRVKRQPGSDVRRNVFVAVRAGIIVAGAHTHRALVGALRKKGIDVRNVIFEHVRPKDRLCAY